MRYIEVIENLEICLNFKSTDIIKAQNNKQLFNRCLVVLKDDFKTDVTTKYLMEFVKADTEKAKSNRVNYLLKEIGLTDKEKISDCYRERNPSLTIKGVNELELYKSVKNEETGEEKIYFKTLPMTSHDYKGIKAPCKVGVWSCKLKTISLNKVLI